MDLHPRCARRLLGVCVAVTLAVVAASAAVYALVDRSTHGRLFDYFYVGTEMNLPTWWNVMLLAGAALAAAGAAALYARERVGWAAVAAATAFLSLDEGSRLHENAGLLVRGLGVPTFGWVVVGAVIAPLGLLVLALLTRRLPRTTRRTLGLLAGLYVAAALGLETLGGYLLGQGHSGAFFALAHVEEALEMVAAAGAMCTILDRILPVRLEAAPVAAPGYRGAGGSGVLPDTVSPRAGRRSGVTARGGSTASRHWGVTARGE